MLPMYPVTVTQLLGTTYHLEQAFWETVQANPEDTLFLDCTAGQITMRSLVTDIRHHAMGKPQSTAVIHRPDLAIFAGTSWQRPIAANQQGWAHYMPIFSGYCRSRGISLVGLFPHDWPSSAWEWRSSVRGIITPSPIQGEWDVELLKYRVKE